MTRRRHSPGCPCDACVRPALPCGCVRGRRLCAEAIALWDAVVEAFKVDHRRGEGYEGYEAKRAVYEAHFAVEAEDARQEALI